MNSSFSSDIQLYSCQDRSGNDSANAPVVNTLDTTIGGNPLVNSGPEETDSPIGSTVVEESGSPESNTQPDAPVCSGGDLSCVNIDGGCSNGENLLRLVSSAQQHLAHKIQGNIYTYNH